MGLASPPFTREIPAGVAVGSTVSFSFENANEPESSHLPLNYLFVQNFSGQRVKVDAGRVAVIVPGNSAMVVDEPGIRGYSVTNLDTANATTDSIYVTVKREVSEKHALVALALKIPLDRAMDGGY